MRIDDENKVVWCSESEMEWYVSFNLSTGNWGVCDFKRIFDLATEKGLSIEFEVNPIEKLKIIESIVKGYVFKLKEQKYYWRKKKEHLAWFEDSSPHLILHIKENRLLMWKHKDFDTNLFKGEFTDQQARDLLKDDFDKFEKVEVE